MTTTTPLLPRVSLAFRGEFGIEMGTFLPHVYWLHAHGLVSRVTSFRGMRPWYWFLADDQWSEHPGGDSRGFVAAEHRTFLPPHLRDDEALMAAPLLEPPPQFLPPPLADFYAAAPGGGGDPRPLAVIQNKRNSEWGSGSVNFFDAEELAAILDVLRPAGYRVAYLRSDGFRHPDYSHDHNEAESWDDLGEREVLESRGVEMIGPEGFNEAKCRLLGAAALTVSVIGGFNHSAAYFPARHAILCKWLPPGSAFCRELYQNMHDMLCPGRSSPILWATDADSLVAQLRDFVGKERDGAASREFDDPQTCA